MSGSRTGSPPKYVFAVGEYVPVGSPSLFSTGWPAASWSTGTVYVSTVVVAPDVLVASMSSDVVAGERRAAVRQARGDDVGGADERRQLRSRRPG